MEHKAVAEITVEEIAATGVPAEEAGRFHAALQHILAKHENCVSEAWKSISQDLLTPDLPFSLHRMLYYGCYKTYPDDPPPAWIPDGENASSTNVGGLLQRRGQDLLGLQYKDPISSFLDFQTFSVINPDVYWNAVFEEMGISFSQQPNSILHDNYSNFGGQWLPGAYLNSAGLCLSVNAKKGLDDVVIIWRDEGDDTSPVHTMTLKELRTEVWHTAHALDAMSLPKNSNIAIDMPMSVTAVIIYLAIILADCVVVSIADSFASDEIATRLQITDARAIFTQDFILRGGKELPLYSKVVEAHAPLAIVVPARGSAFIEGLREGDISWHDFLARAESTRDVPYATVDPPIEKHMNILFSSGTTGDLLGIPWTHVTPLKAAADAWAHMDIRKGDVVAWPSNLGWMMGPWLVYASLLNGASMALYNGTPLGRGFAKFVQDAKVTMLGVIPSIVRAWKSTDCTAGLDWSAIRCFSSSGEASNMDDCLWLMGRAYYKPVIEYCGGTEIGGGFVTGSLLQPQALAAFSTPAMGCKLFILGPDGDPLPEEAPWSGELALYPSILGSTTSLINGNHYDIYFRGMPMYKEKILRRHGDEIELTSGGYYRAHGRVDDTMKLGGIKVSSVEIERICNVVDNAILETAAVGVPPSTGGPEQLVIAVVFKDQNLVEENLDKLRVAFNYALQAKLNPLIKVSSVVPMICLPRNAASKVMRRSLREQFSEQS